MLREKIGPALVFLSQDADRTAQPLDRPFSPHWEQEIQKRVAEGSEVMTSTVIFVLYREAWEPARWQ